MEIAIIAVMITFAFIGGVIIALRSVGSRPININVDNHAEAHSNGRTTTGSSVTTPSSPNSLSGIGKWIKIAAAIGLALFAVSTIGQIAAMNAPKAAPVIVNVPTQEAPKIVMPPPVINVPTPVVPSPVDDTPLLLAIAVILLVLTVMCLVIYFRLRERPLPEKIQTPQAPPIIDYTKTDYGWSPVYGKIIEQQVPEKSQMIEVPKQNIVEEFFAKARHLG